jgi:hypothetical protein
MDKKDYSKLSFFSGSNTEIRDLLSDEQRELLLSAVSKNSHSTPPLRARDLEFTMYLEPTHGKSSVRALKCKVISKNVKKAFEALLWYAFFGSTKKAKFRVFHWYVLWNFFLRTMRKNSRSSALMSILRITTQQCGIALNQNLRPVKTVVSYFLGKEETLELIKRLQRNLGVKLAHRRIPLDEFFHISEISIPLKKPSEPRRIGVGYKDKGHLPISPPEEGINDESYCYQQEDVFRSLLSKTQWSACFSESYDPKKRKKLIEKLLARLKEGKE